MLSLPRSLFLFLATSVCQTAAQTFSQCNPLSNPGACPPNPALGQTTTVSFNSASDSFGATGTVNYGSDGAQFTVQKTGDNPHLSSKWYIMFGHVEFQIKAAPGQGIVSSAVLMSDCLDEIDWEWLGGDNNQVQSNYFRKGQTVPGYNRGAFHDAQGTHDNFHTYAIDWTADQIVWSIDGQTVRVLEATAAQNGDYPQTPMQIKVGAWAGGDPSNPQGTIDWAGGLTDYSAGPFTMYLKSIAVTDYSTGSSYSYSGTTGTWQSIQSDGGSINSQGNGTPVSAGNTAAVTSTVPNDSSAPLAFDPDDSASVYATRTGWPWEGTATASTVPTGWSIDGNGNAHPPSTGAAPSPSFSSPQASLPGFSSDSGPEIPTGPITAPSASASSISDSEQHATVSPPDSLPVPATSNLPPGQSNSDTAVESTKSLSASGLDTAGTTNQLTSNTLRSGLSSMRSTIATSTTSGSPPAIDSPSSATSRSSNPVETPQAPSAGAGQNLSPWPYPLLLALGSLLLM